MLECRYNVLCRVQRTSNAGAAKALVAAGGQAVAGDAAQTLARGGGAGTQGREPSSAGGESERRPAAPPLHRVVLSDDRPPLICRIPPADFPHRSLRVQTESNFVVVQ